MYMCFTAMKALLDNNVLVIHNCHYICVYCAYVYVCIYKYHNTSVSASFC